MLEYKIILIERGELPKRMIMKFNSILAYDDFYSKHVIGTMMCRNKPPALLCTKNNLN